MLFAQYVVVASRAWTKTRVGLHDLLTAGSPPAQQAVARPATRCVRQSIVGSTACRQNAPFSERRLLCKPINLLTRECRNLNYIRSAVVSRSLACNKACSFVESTFCKKKDANEISFQKALHVTSTIVRRCYRDVKLAPSN
jgi:hypothetical protein